MKRKKSESDNHNLTFEQAFWGKIMNSARAYNYSLQGQQGMSEPERIKHLSDSAVLSVNLNYQSVRKYLLSIRNSLKTQDQENQNSWVFSLIWSLEYFEKKNYHNAISHLCVAYSFKNTEQNLSFLEGNPEGALERSDSYFLNMLGKTQKILLDTGYRKSKGEGGRAKGKKQQKEVLAAWEAHTSKKSYEAFANKYVEDNGGFNADGKPARKGIPAIKTIVRWVSEYETQRKNPVF